MQAVGEESSKSWRAVSYQGARRVGTDYSASIAALADDDLSGEVEGSLCPPGVFEHARGLRGGVEVGGGLEVLRVYFIPGGSQGTYSD